MLHWWVWTSFTLIPFFLFRVPSSHRLHLQVQLPAHDASNPSQTVNHQQTWLYAHGDSPPRVAGFATSPSNTNLSWVWGCQSDQKESAKNKVFLINCLLGWAIPKVQIGALVNDDDDEEEEEEEDAASFWFIFHAQTHWKPSHDRVTTRSELAGLQ